VGVVIRWSVSKHRMECAERWEAGKRHKSTPSQGVMRTGDCDVHMQEERDATSFTVVMIPLL
jgi:hypothetical protein